MVGGTGNVRLGSGNVAHGLAPRGARNRVYRLGDLQQLADRGFFAFNVRRTF
jgi:hypothetical protein